MMCIAVFQNFNNRLYIFSVIKIYFETQGFVTNTVLLRYFFTFQNLFFQLKTG